MRQVRSCLNRTQLNLKMAAYRRIIMQRNQNRQIRRPRLFRDRSNPLEEYNNEELFIRYRFRRETILFLLEILPDLGAPTRRNLPVPPVLQLLITLRYLATGAIHLLVGDSVNVSRSTAGRLHSPGRATFSSTGQGIHYISKKRREYYNM